MAKTLAVLSLLGVLAPLLTASTFDLQRTPSRRVALFAQEEPAPAAGEETSHPKPAVTPDNSPPPRGFNVAAWATPYTRFPAAPSGALGGIGMQGAFMFQRNFGVLAGASLWHGVVAADDDTTDIVMFELESGPRFRMVEWHSGSLYFDLKLRLGFAGGSDPVDASVTFGAGAAFGIEFGSPSMRGFLEFNVAYLGAVNRGDAGWVDVGDANGFGGPHFNILRFGVRVYL